MLVEDRRDFGLVTNLMVALVAVVHNRFVRMTCRGVARLVASIVERREESFGQRGIPERAKSDSSVIVYVSRLVQANQRRR